MAEVIFERAALAKAFVVFAHGAGADKSSDFMNQMSKILISNGLSVLRFNFDYMNKRLLDGKKYPPERMPKLLSCLNQILSEQVTAHNTDSLPVFLAGKSMGGRVSAMITSELDEVKAHISHDVDLKGTICLGYPFHPQGKPEKLRLEPLQQRKSPVLVIQGDRDKLGSKEEIAGYELDRSVKVTYLPDGDHDLKPRVKSGFTHKAHIEKAAKLTAQFIEQHS